MEKALQLSFFDGVKDKTPKMHEATWDELRSYLCSYQWDVPPPEGGKDDPAVQEWKRGLLAWSPASYQRGSTRGKGNVVEVACLVFDVDSKSEDLVEKLRESLEGIEWFAVSSPSDHLDPNLHCLRVVVRITQPVPRRDFDRVWRAVADLLPDGVIDSSAADPSRLWFVAQADHAEHHPGRPLDWPALIASKPEVEPESFREWLLDPGNRRGYMLPDVVQEGNRNNEMFRYGAHLCSLNLRKAEILARMHEANAKRFNPPMGREEVEQCFNSALSYEGAHAEVLRNHDAVNGERTPEVIAALAALADRGCWEHREARMDWYRRRRMAKSPQLREIKAEIKQHQVAEVASLAEARAAQGTWLSRLASKVTKDGVFIYPSYDNLLIALREAPEFKGKLRHDERTLMRYFGDGPLTDLFYAKFREWAIHTISRDVTKSDCYDAVDQVAGENPFNPVHDYLNSLPVGSEEDCAWAEGRLVEWLGAEDTELSRAQWRTWLANAVRRGYVKGGQTPPALILAGPEGIGKSSLGIELAAPVEGYLETSATLTNKDNLLRLSRAWLVELSELASFRRTENEQIKAFLTADDDVYRQPYARAIQRVPRRCVFFGTTNEAGGFLTAGVGYRRFWLVVCQGGGPKDVRRLWREGRDRIWSAAKRWYQDGVGPALPEELLEGQRESLQRAVEVSDMQQVLEEAVEALQGEYDGVTTAWARKAIQSRDIRYHGRGAAEAMLQLGFHQARYRLGGRVTRVWLREGQEVGAQNVVRAPEER